MATDYPKKGDDKKVSLRNSNFDRFPFDWAIKVKDQTPEIWDAGGNIRGNEAFKLYERALDGDDAPSVMDWIREREAWAARHFEDGRQFKGDTDPTLSNIAGVVAQIKWGVVGTLGEQGMKDAILSLTKKLEGKRAVNKQVETGLKNKVEDHNKEIADMNLDWDASVNYQMLLEVFERGVGAFKTNPESVRPGMNAESWAYARVNSFLYALKKGKYQGGKHDTDLLPDNHPIKKEMEMENKNLNLENRHIQKIEETDESIIIYYGKSEADVEMVDEQDMPEDMPENEPMEEMPEENEHYDDDEHMKRSSDVEKRNFSLDNVEIRSDENGKKRVVGYGSVFNKLSEDLGGFREMIMPGAFDSVMDNDVRLLFNHDQNLVLGRTASGTLQISVDENGLRYSAELPDTTFAKDLTKLMERGDINQSSFSFVIENDSWEQTENGMPLRKINKVKRLYDTSIVTTPAYPDAGVGLRSLEKHKIENGLKKDVNDRKNEELDLHRRSLASYKVKMAKLK